MEFVQKVIFGTITVDWKTTWLLKGAGGMQLMGISGRICYQTGIYEENLKEMMGFEFEFCYKLRIMLPIQTLCALRLRSENFCLQECQASYCMSEKSYEDIELEFICRGLGFIMMATPSVTSTW